jgi:hypothetical protein
MKLLNLDSSLTARVCRAAWPLTRDADALPGRTRWNLRREVEMMVTGTKPARWEEFPPGWELTRPLFGRRTLTVAKSDAEKDTGARLSGNLARTKVSSFALGNATPTYLRSRLKPSVKCPTARWQWC